MQYLLINMSQGNLQVDLHDPERATLKKNQKLHREAPVISLNIKKGANVDILPIFDGSLEKTHECVKYSRDVIRALRPDRLNIFVCDDENKEIDIDALLGEPKEVEEEAPESVVTKPHKNEPQGEGGAKSDEDATKPDMGEGAILAAVDQHEVEMRGEADELETETEDKKKTTKKKKSKK